MAKALAIALANAWARSLVKALAKALPEAMHGQGFAQGYGQGMAMATALAKAPGHSLEAFLTWKKTRNCPCIYLFARVPDGSASKPAKLLLDELRALPPT